MKNGLIINGNGDKSWYINGKLHREDGPAIEYADGDKYWYINNMRHRLDGPAVEYADGNKYWYINGNIISDEQIEDLFGCKISELTIPLSDTQQVIMKMKFWK